MSTKRGLGTWFKRGNIWWIKYHKDGKPFRESSGSDKESDAKQLLKNRLGEISKGTFAGLEYKRLTFDDLAQELLDDYKVNQRKSYWRAQLSLKHLKGFFGGMKMARIDTALIRKYVKDRLVLGRSNATVNRELAALRRMFKIAAQDDRISKVPHFPMLRENNVRTGFLEPEQYEKLRAELPEYLKPVLLVAYWTGCRKTEILGLKWQQVDFLNRNIVLEVTKNDEPRIIPMSDEVYETLLTLQKTRPQEGKGVDLVFTNKGKPIRYIYDAWRAAAERAGMPGILLHDCRRSAVRNLVRAGSTQKAAREISGHKTASVFDRYNIVDEKDMKDAMTKLQYYMRKHLGTVWAQSPTNPTIPENQPTEVSGDQAAVSH